MLLTPFYLYADRSESQYDAKTRENVDDNILHARILWFTFVSFHSRSHIMTGCQTFAPSLECWKDVAMLLLLFICRKYLYFPPNTFCCVTASQRCIPFHSLLSSAPSFVLRPSSFPFRDLARPSCGFTLSPRRSHSPSLSKNATFSQRIL